MKVFCAVFFVLGSLVRLEAQEFGGPYGWYNGVIVTTQGDTIRGEMNYNHARKLVLLKDSMAVKSLSSRNVKFFRFYDPAVRLVRTYSGISLYRTPGYMSTEFFELIIDGPISVIRDGYLDKFNQVKYAYYAYTENQLTPWRRFQKDLLPDMERDQPKLREEIQTRSLKPNKRFDRILIIDAFNALSDPSYQRRLVEHYPTERLLDDLR